MREKKGGRYMSFEEWLVESIGIIVMCIAATIIFRKKK